jgi:hypothetical protein
MQRRYPLVRKRVTERQVRATKDHMKDLDDALDELIAALSDAKAPLTDSLFKTKVIFHQMGKTELLPWVTYELEGYPIGNPELQLPQNGDARRWSRWARMMSAPVSSEGTMSP